MQGDKIIALRGFHDDLVLSCCFCLYARKHLIARGDLNLDGTGGNLVQVGKMLNIIFDVMEDRPDVIDEKAHFDLVVTNEFGEEIFNDDLDDEDRKYDSIQTFI